MRATKNTYVVVSLEDIKTGHAAAPFCDEAEPRVCPTCGHWAVLPLNAKARLAQPDETTHVCHPVIGGCNGGFTVYA